MAYHIVLATLPEPESGAFLAEAKTLRDAIEKAQDLRKQGLDVKITGPDGKPVDETEHE